MNKWLVIVILVVLGSCGTSKSVEGDLDMTDPQENNSVEDHNILISIDHHGSYCGGMAPTPEMLAALNYKQANTAFILVHLSSNTKANVKTDSLGQLKLSLVPGKYAIREYFKNCTFEEFLKQQKTAEGQYYQNIGGEDCYKKWWESNLLDFEITGADTVLTYNLSTSTRCFVGNNPCLQYTGPYPP